MKVSVYWSALQSTLIGWLVILSVAAGGLVIVMHRQSAAVEALAQVKKQLQQYQQQARYQADYQEDIRFFLAHRDRWQALGLTQLPNIDQWEAAWESMQQTLALPHLAYQVQPTVICTGGACRQQWPTSEPPELQFTVTPIQLSWSVRHESAVTDWLQQFKQAYPGMLLRRCRWAMAAGEQAIAAECDLDIFNFPDPLPAT